MLPSRSVREVAARTTVSHRSGRRKTLGWAGDHRRSQWHAAALLGLVPNHARRVAGFDEAIVSPYARGLTTADIRAHLAETYGVEVSHDLVSRVTDQVARRAASRHMRCQASIACSSASSCSTTFATVARCAPDRPPRDSPGSERILMVDGSQLATTHPDLMRAQQLVSGQDRYVVGEQSIPSHPLRPLTHTLHEQLVKPSVDAAEDDRPTPEPCCEMGRTCHRALSQCRTGAGYLIDEVSCRWPTQPVRATAG